jgi:hypothetical protein
MDPKMSSSLGVLACLLIAACATPPPKQADNYDESPPGGSSGGSSWSSHASSSETSAAASESPSAGTPSSSESSGASGGATTSDAATALPADAGYGWDRDLTAAELARAARSVKANCGSATDTDGHATGPWGKTQVTVVLHHRGKTKNAKAQGEYAGTPAGRCIERAFTDLHFPPWQGHDVTIQYDIEVVHPK